MEVNQVHVTYLPDWSGIRDGQQNSDSRCGINIPDPGGSGRELLWLVGCCDRIRIRTGIGIYPHRFGFPRSGSVRYWKFGSGSGSRSKEIGFVQLRRYILCDKKYSEAYLLNLKHVISAFFISLSYFGFAFQNLQNTNKNKKFHHKLWSRHIRTMRTRTPESR